MFTNECWKDYELLDATNGERLERWGKYILIRPDPQVIWNSPRRHPLWNSPHGVYRRAKSGGGQWVVSKMPADWNIRYGELEFKLRPIKIMEKKMTKKEMFTLIATLNASNQAIVDFCNHEIELLDNKKSNGNKKANEKMEKSVELVYNALVSVGRAVTTSELIAETDLSALVNESGVVSTQKVSAMLKKLKEQGKVESYTDKKKTYFRIKAE